MAKITFHRLWERSLVEPVKQPQLEFQECDSKKSFMCPIYTNACKLSIYLVLTEDVSIHWGGGPDVEVKTADWWKSTYLKAKRDWFSGDGASSAGKSRYYADAPFASLSGGSFLHAGGIMLNFFTGLTIKTEPGVKTFVTRPTNHFTAPWTIQDGYYDSDIFRGDFSFNLQILRTDPIFLRRGTPIASVMPVFPQSELDFSFESSQPQSDKDEATAFYLAKATGRKYAQLVSNSQ